MKKILIETKAIKLTTSDSPNNGFYTGTVDLGNFSTPFYATPKVIATMSSANGHTILVGITGTSPMSWGKATIISNSQRTNMENFINLMAVQVN